MRRLHLLLLAIVLLFPLTGKSDEKLETLKSIYAGELDKIFAQQMDDMAVVQKAYLNYLDAELKKATDRGDLDAYKKTEAEKTRFQEEKTIPANTPVQDLVGQAELRKNAAVVSLSKKYLAGLNSHKIALMQAKDINGASSVQDEVSAVEAVVKELTSKLPAKTPAGSTTAAENNSGPVKLAIEQKKGLVLWYDFDREMDDKVMDQSGKKNHGTNTGAKKVSAGRAMNNAAMEFSKSEDMIVSSEKVGIAEDADRTVAVWAKVKPTSAGFQRLLGWGENAIGRAFYLCTYKGQWTVLIPGPSRSVSTGTAIDSSEWLHHVVVCEKGAANWYINGTPIARGAKIKTSPQDSKLTIGGDNNEMMMDDVMIWNRALSEDEVKQVYKATGGK